ncbi:DUF1836 domain-containing protein [Loigolactobacillus zhaoyuanensis]|uniref:DUF1836 domain-containing protein n=1 Tax=Loigolactobacillus zhaoyuanensis TaxID=2486017 RepID=A0ABW8UF60_9LACO|nr:DUF1836 domain-containing protein [Loigolactobacillus zhaoyuanensis]
MTEIKFNVWLTTLAAVRLPLWQELPEFDLYMDQVITETDRYLRPLSIEPLTKSMVNSYVKRNIIHRPEKKHYTRAHLAEIMIVSLFKAVFPLETIHSGIHQAVRTTTPQLAYDQFIERINTELAQLDQPAATPLFSSTDATHVLTQKAAIRAILYQIISQHTLATTQKDAPQA